jgi:hypothetical protein
MSKLTIGTVAAGAVLASAAALTVVVGLNSGSDNGKAARDIALEAGATTAASTNADPTGGAGSDVSDPGKANQAPGQAQAASQPKAAAAPRAVKPIRSVRLTLPTIATKVGANVTGTITVVDTAGKVVTPAEGVAVALQQLRGKSYVTISDGVTEADGQFGVSFTSKVNTTWRAQALIAGKKVYTPTVVTKASASATWAARPDMDVTRGVPSKYAFRVGSETAAVGHLEIANSKTPTKWIALKNVSVPASDVITQSQSFPTAGTWLLRGATAGTTVNAPGYTTVLEITVR